MTEPVDFSNDPVVIVRTFEDLMNAVQADGVANRPVQVYDRIIEGSPPLTERQRELLAYIHNYGRLLGGHSAHELI